MANSNAVDVGDEAFAKLWQRHQTSMTLVKRPCSQHPQESPAIHGVIIITKAARIPIGGDWVNAVMRTELTIATMARAAVGRRE